MQYCFGDGALALVINVCKHDFNQPTVYRLQFIITV